MSVRLLGIRHCGSCRRLGPVSNAFTNGLGWRELCDPCAEGAPSLGRAPALPALRSTAR